jgi:malate synthase
MLDQEFTKLERFEGDRFADAVRVFQGLVYGPDFPAFLNTAADDLLVSEQP